MVKTIREISLVAQPPDTAEAFEILREAGSRSMETRAFGAFALFGGAIRDSDYAARHNLQWPVNDYDLRVWLPQDYHDERVQDFARHMGAVAGVPVEEVPSLGSGRIRYYLTLPHMEMDVSIRPEPNRPYDVTEVARTRAMDADIGLSSVAIASTFQAFAATEYEQDRDNRTLTVYPDPNPAIDRVVTYTAKMQNKFPDHTVVYL